MTNPKTLPDEPGTRTRLINAMVHTLQYRGLHGAGLSEILARAQAPKGVLYHHFPGGKTALAVAAIEATVSFSCAMLDKLMQGHADPAVGLRAWIARAMGGLGESGFERGCPLGTVALESTAADVEIRQALCAGFAAIRGRIAAALAAAGHDAARAEGVAALMVAAYEGGLLQARVANDVGPMLQATETLLSLLDQPAPGPKDPPCKESP
ncbi:TetR/AcrR family transcriptional regulator [Pseudoduganella namucuonensis]|uniref:Transcriptional regulator, TetR family n=1 Tax=Pseudoduganella namucuonensis TaxID=1035707 RepID=A0A1I7KZ81_9BURK|nr:TetR/AcrR family transcriptional regulator [Pseudoduganella namucuonensis]SFV02783.1 transcriptional regulator, TetR family [Pseudoduganella namucuonensis]